ncbi:MAG: YeeE/YedE family protein [Cytophagales bacterium]|nr:YeeE/YedE family protein [Cytophagales bacterium]
MKHSKTTVLETAKWEKEHIPGNKLPHENSRLENFIENLKYIIGGTLFGIVLIKSEVISWFRIQEMFRLQSFHMYGVIGTAILTGIISIQLLKKFKVKAINGESISIRPKEFSKGQIYGGLAFGFGWALTGACPGPIYAQIGAGFLTTIITLLSAIAGVWVYGRFRHKLPH